MTVKVLNFLSASSLRMECAQKSRRLLDVRRFEPFLIWLIVAGSLKRITMLITRLLMIREERINRTVANLMILVRVNKELLRVRGLVGEMLLLEWYVSNVCNLVIRLMCALLLM